MAIKINPIESSDDYFCDQKTNNIPAESLFQQDPANIIEFLEGLDDEALSNEDIDAIRQV